MLCLHVTKGHERVMDAILLVAFYELISFIRNRNIPCAEVHQVMFLSTPPGGRPTTQ